MTPPPSVSWVCSPPQHFLLDNLSPPLMSAGSTSAAPSSPNIQILGCFQLVTWNTHNERNLFISSEALCCRLGLEVWRTLKLQQFVQLNWLLGLQNTMKMPAFASKHLCHRLHYSLCDWNSPAFPEWYWSWVLVNRQQNVQLGVKGWTDTSEENSAQSTCGLGAGMGGMHHVCSLVFQRSSWAMHHVFIGVQCTAGGNVLCVHWCPVFILGNALCVYWCPVFILGNVFTGVRCSAWAMCYVLTDVWCPVLSWAMHYVFTSVQCSSWAMCYVFTGVYSTRAICYVFTGVQCSCWENVLCVHWCPVFILGTALCVHWCLLFNLGNLLCVHWCPVFMLGNVLCVHWCPVFTLDNVLCLLVSSVHPGECIMCSLVFIVQPAQYVTCALVSSVHAGQCVMCSLVSSVHPGQCIMCSLILHSLLKLPSRCPITILKLFQSCAYTPVHHASICHSVYVLLVLS